MAEEDGDLINAAAESLHRFENAEDLHVEYLMGELRPALHAFVQARNARGRAEILGEYMYLRLLAECALRVAWVASDLSSVDAIRGRVDSLRKRDLMNLLEASDQIHSLNGSVNPVREELLGQASAIGAQPAPRNFSKMVTGDTTNGPYSVHRMCSVVVHVGAGLRSLVNPPAENMAYDTLRTCAVLSVGVACRLTAIEWPTPEMASIATG